MPRLILNEQNREQHSDNKLKYHRNADTDKLRCALLEAID